METTIDLESTKSPKVVFDYDAVDDTVELMITQGEDSDSMFHTLHIMMCLKMAEQIRNALDKAIKEFGVSIEEHIKKTKKKEEPKKKEFIHPNKKVKGIQDVESEIELEKFMGLLKPAIRLAGGDPDGEWEELPLNRVFKKLHENGIYICFKLEPEIFYNKIFGLRGIR